MFIEKYIILGAVVALLILLINVMRLESKVKHIIIANGIVGQCLEEDFKNIWDNFETHEKLMKEMDQDVGSLIHTLEKKDLL